jgi:uncharacterized protein (DUF433 family)
MPDDRLAHAARQIIKLASAPVQAGDREWDQYVLVPANTIRWLEEALTPEQRAPSPYVSIDPKLKFGQPCIHGHRITAEQIADMYWHMGEDMQGEILDAYDMTRAEVIACCYWAAQYGTRQRRTRWQAWLTAAWDNTREGHGWWSEQFEDVPLPPTRKQSQEASDDQRITPTNAPLRGTSA